MSYAIVTEDAAYGPFTTSEEARDALMDAGWFPPDESALPGGAWGKAGEIAFVRWLAPAQRLKVGT